MKRYALIFISIPTSLLALFVICSSLDIPILSDPYEIARDNSLETALLGCGLLVSDILIPVPSSLIMTVHGKLFGIWLGTLVSLSGSLGMALLGYAIGLTSGVFINKHISQNEQIRAKYLIKKWGALAIVLSRPIPIIAETVAVIAGMSRLNLIIVIFATLSGAFPMCLVYAVAGYYAAGVKSNLIILTLVILVTIAFWGIGQYLHKDEGSNDKVEIHAAD